MSINEVRYLPECGSTNAYVKEHFEEFGPVGAVYTTNQTAGRGRLGRSWVNAEGKALYYTVAIREPLAQPATLPLLASLAVRSQLKLRYGVDCQIKWPNDLLLKGKKIVGILCESVSYGYEQQGRGILCGIGINLAQPQSYFDAADLPHGTSLALQGAAVDLAADPQWLAEGLTDFGFDRPMYVFAREGFAPFREEYKAACVNIGRRVTFDLPGGGQGAGDVRTGLFLERLAHAGNRAGQREGIEHVVAHPRAQTDVPAPPEIAEGDGEIRPLEVRRKLYAEELGDARHQINAAGKIRVLLEGVKQHTDDDDRAAVGALVAENRFHQ